MSLDTPRVDDRAMSDRRLAQWEILIALKTVKFGDHNNHRTTIIIYHLPKIFKCIGQWSLSRNELCLISSINLQIVYDMRQMATGVSGQKKKHI